MRNSRSLNVNTTGASILHFLASMSIKVKDGSLNCIYSRKTTIFLPAKLVFMLIEANFMNH